MRAAEPRQGRKRGFDRTAPLPSEKPAQRLEARAQSARVSDEALTVLDSRKCLPRM
jgi:hypothetical protein